MPNDKDTAGKVIVSLLAGATAGIVAGLLLAPETGEEARHDLRKSARKWGKRAQDALQKLQGPPTPGADPDRQAADAQLRAMHPNAEPGDLATPAGAGNGRSIAGDEDYDGHNRDDLDYDGDAGAGRHRAAL